MVDVGASDSPVEDEDEAGNKQDKSLELPKAKDRAFQGQTSVKVKGDEGVEE